MQIKGYLEIERIQTLRKEWKTQSYIATQVQRTQPSISNFMKKYGIEMPTEDIVKEKQARRKDINQEMHCRIKGWSHLAQYIVSRLRWSKDSPEQIAGRWKEEQKEALSKDTVYRFIKTFYPELIYCFRRRWKKYQKRCNPWEEKYQILNRVMIDEREKEYPQCATRKQVWHWEIDTIVSSKTRSHGILTAVERVSWFCMTGYITQKTAWNTCDVLRDLFASIPQEYKLSLTSDNGREFAYHTITRFETWMKFYFAHPYSPWERWSNENTNGLFRQFVPKKESFGGISHLVLQWYTKTLNLRPRKRHQYLTPHEVLFWVRFRLTDLYVLI